MTGKRLLFVDDENAIRETLSIILRRYGFIVTLAASVAQALEEIEEQQFDILLCDLNIERESDGYEVIRAMQKIHPNCAMVYFNRCTCSSPGAVLLCFYCSIRVARAAWKR